MINRILLSTVAVATLTATAFAADLPSHRAPAVFVPPPAPVFSWTGFYFGGNAGYAFQGDRNNAYSGNQPATATLVNSNGVPRGLLNRANGFTGGGQIGYNYEFVMGPTGGVVVGAEADAAYTDLRSSTQAIGTGGFGTLTSGRESYLGTVRGRVGVPIGVLLVYGTGGFAYGGTSDSTNIYTTPAGTNLYRGAQSSTRTGWAAGGGVEYAIPTGSFVNFINAGAVTVKAEYLHYDLGTSSYTLGATGAGGTGATSITDRVRYSGNLVRAGINYKFDTFAPAVPVVARY